MLVWLPVVAAAGVVLFAQLWHDDLAESGAVKLAIHYAAAMARTFLFHASLVLVALGVIALTARRWALAIVAAAAATTALVGSAEIRLPPTSSVAATAPDKSLTIFCANLWYGRMEPARLLEQIAAADPDVIVFQEWTQRAHAALSDALASKYPHVVEAPRSDAFGQSVFSKRPFLSEPEMFPPGGGFTLPQIGIAVDLDGQPCFIRNIHLLPPVRPWMFAEQRRQARRLAEWCADEAAPSRPHVLIGDFNAVPGSRVIGAIADAGYRLAHDDAGRWRASTWPLDGARAYLPGIAIDHALVSRRMRTLAYAINDDVGADHAPVVVRVAWPAR